MEPARNRSFPLVHTMRAVAALSVLLYHGAFKAYLAGHPHSPLTPFAAHLDVGVPVFFLISAFLLYRPMVAARLRGEQPIDAEAYGWRRLMRIVPGYWVALLLAGIVGASYLGFPEIFSAKGSIAYFGFLQIYSPDTAAGGINVAWTLCVEVTFYAFLPLWALALRRISPRGGVRSELVALAGLFAASVAWQLFAVHSTDPNGFGLGGARWLEPLPAFLDQFAVGMALAVASVAFERRAPARIRPVLAWIVGAVAFWVVSTRIGLHGTPADDLTPARYLARHQLYTVIALALLLPAVFGSRSEARRRAPLVALGTVSYGIYLYHVPVFLKLAEWRGLPRSPGGLMLWLAMGIPATLALAWLSWRLVERPAMRWRPRGRRVAAATRVATPAPARR
jgi:peptidoglycan/LPS O-acetylase OafA/YrhL